MESHHSRPSRLEKQEEFEEEEDSFMLSPVTIQIEDRGGNPSEDQDDKSKDSSGSFEDSSPSGKSSNPDHLPDDTDMWTEAKPERRKSSGRVKLLVRSHAVHDDASPPPDLETIITNTNMLSVTNAPSFGTQSKGGTNKLRLGGSSSQGSTESSSASGLSRDSSTETYTDSSGIDLHQFIVDTLHKNQKDRLMLLKVEQDLTTLIKDSKRQSMKFPQMSSYNRMLVHRVAAFFGLDHYVDGNGTAVIVNRTKSTRIPDYHFQDFIRDELLPEEPKKSILKRDSISFEEGKEKSPERQSSTDSRRSKSFEEREEEYEKARARIFNQDEGFGESPLNRSQEGTHCSSHRSSQEDVRWPSSETRPWSSTDSDSSGRPLGSKLSNSFETDTPIQSCKVTRPLGVSIETEVENKSLLLTSKSARRVMTKASSFGGISVLSRESSCGWSVPPKITKAESFNVTTISSSPVPKIIDGSFDPEKENIKESENHFDLVASACITIQSTTCPFSSVFITAEETVPIMTSQLPEKQDSGGHQTTCAGQPGKEFSKDCSSASSIIQPLTWPYSTGTDLLFPEVFIHPQTGFSRVTLAANHSVSATEQVSTTVGHISLGSVSSSSKQRAQPLSMPSQIQQSLTTVNSSTPTVFYVPYVASVPSSVTHQSSIASVQSVRHQAQLSNFVADSRSVVLLPVCFLPHTSNIQCVRHSFSPSTSSKTVQCSGIHVTNIDVKSYSPSTSTSLYNHPHIPGFPALACTKSGEHSHASTATTTIYQFGNINVGTSGNMSQAPFKSSLTNQSSQPPACIHQSFMHLQGTSITLPPVYVSITSSTQSPATRTHAGGHLAAQFSSSRSQSLPVSSNSAALPHSSGPAFVGYTIVTPSAHGLPSASPLAAVLPPNVPLVASIANNSLPLVNVLRSQYSAPICTMSKMPLSFPLVKQTSDPGIGEHGTLANSVYLVGHPMQQHIGHLLLPHQPSMTRFPVTSVTPHPPANRLTKPRKHRSKACGSSLNPPSIFEGEGRHILKVEGLPADIKRNDVDNCLEIITGTGAKILFVTSENLKVINDSSDFIVSSSKHIVLAVFDSDAAAKNAILCIKTTKFQLRHWHGLQDFKNLEDS